MTDIPRRAAIRFSIVEDEDTSEALRDAQGALDTIPVVDRYVVDCASPDLHPNGLVLATSAQMAGKPRPAAVVFAGSQLLQGDAESSTFPDTADVRWSGLYFLDVSGALRAAPPRGVPAGVLLRLTFLAFTWPSTM